jgi:RNA polymerase sigma-70 factor (ECF subfamily)
MYIKKTLLKGKEIHLKDEEIIRLYFRRDERAIAETSSKYGNYCASIVRKILCNDTDVEECLDDTYMKAWTTIPPTRPGIFRVYLGKIARNLAFNMYEHMTAGRRGGGTVDAVLDELEECIPASSDVEQHIIGSELSYLIRCFVNSLPEKDACIFTERYFYTAEIRDIACKYGMSRNNVSVTLSRLRSRLKKELEKEGYLVS